MHRRVVVTGIGMITPIGKNITESWDNLINGVCGVENIKEFDTSSLPCRIGAWIKHKTEDNPDGLDLDLYMSPKERKKIDKFITIGLIASDDAIKDANWFPDNDYDREMTSVIVGSGIGGLPNIEESSVKLNTLGFKKISPFFIPSVLVNLLPGHIAIRNKFYGTNMSVSTACATSAHTIGEAATIIRDNRANVVITGGSESVICPMAIAGFAAGRALATKFNDNPKEASRPWDKDHNGFVIGEGSGMLVLEEYEHAKKRGAKIYAELIGYGTSCDAHHITAPPEDGSGALRAMQIALKRAGLTTDDIDYINAHGTSTPVGDSAELNAVVNLFKPEQRKKTLYMSSTKSAIGHLLGAAGGVEAIISILTLINGIVPPTLNLHNPIREHKNLNLVPFKAIKTNVTNVLSNSFGFGGTNASLIFSRLR